MNYDDIEIREVESRSQLSAFIKLPWKIYKGNPNWVPPLISSVKAMLDTKNNPFYRSATIKLYTAHYQNEMVGRIAAIVNHSHNSFHDENIGFFGFFESVNDYNVARKLLKVAMIHLKSQGLDRMRGPVNLSTNYETGALVDAFDLPPMINMIYNPDYYPGLFERFGLAKAKDLLAYKITEYNEPPERMVRIVEKIRHKANVVVRTLNMKKFDDEVRAINRIYNDAWEKNWGFIPMSEDEFFNIAKDMKQIIDPDLAFIAEIDGKPVGLQLALPDVNQVLPYVNGRLFPFGFFKLLWHTKVRNKINSVRVITMGIKQSYQKRGIDNIFYLEIFRRGARKGYKWGEMSWILEDNEMMNRAAKMLGSRVYKRYRIYDISLNAK